MSVVAPTRDVAQVLLGFARTLRHAGVDAGPARVQAMMSALEHLDVLDGGQVYWAGRLTLCAGLDDLHRYDAAFSAYFSGLTLQDPSATSRQEVRIRTSVLEPDVPERGASETGNDTASLAVKADWQETLRHKDIAALSPAEREQLWRLFQLLAPRVGRRRTHRRGPARRGSIDIERTVRHMMRQGGEPAQLRRRARRTRPRRLVLLIDVSGSMAPYAEAFLRFAHAGVRAAPAGTEVFTIGTRLTRITRELRQRDPDRALAAAGNAIPDWSGGTRLGELIKAFLDRWGQRGAARGAIAAVCSDGWERGDPSLLGEQLMRLARLAHSVVWVNPHQGKDGFAPVTGGMLAALPHVDRLVAGHSFATLQQLVEVIADA